MRLVARVTCGWLGPGAVGLLLVVWLCAPAAARASCGSYVVIGGKTNPHAADMAPHEHAPPTDGPCPCSGPHCSRGPLSLPPAPATSAPVRGDHWARTITALVFHPSESLPLAAEDELGRPLHRAPGIYHPPR